MTADVKIGQKWSAWVPGRGQWLLTTVVRWDSGQVVLQFDARYGLKQGHDEQRADRSTMLGNTSLFRLVGP